MGSILYCGDTDLTGAAGYLANLISTWGWKLDYVPSSMAMSHSLLETPRSLLILSDYMASQFDLECQKSALRLIEQGCGLLMIGGWESFHGFGGNWDGTLLGSVLPVEIQTTDDRVNFEQSAWLLPTAKHPIIAGLPWSTNPPAIGGMNRVKAKPDATVVLNAHAYSVSAKDLAVSRTGVPPELSFVPRETLPALVVGQVGAGRTAAFLSDVAPHWVGGLVDWGTSRVTADVTYYGRDQIGHHHADFWKSKLDRTTEVQSMTEVGELYAQFWKQLLQWTGPSIEA